MTISQPKTILVNTDAATAAAERVELWRDVMRLVGEIDVPQPETFVGRFTASELGDMRIVRVASSTYHVRRSRSIGAPMPREHVILNLVERGSVLGKIGNRKGVANQGDLTLSRTTNDLDLTFEDTTWLGLLIPRHVLDRHLRWQLRFDGLIHRAGSVQATLLGGLLRSLCSLPDTLSPSEISRATAATFSLMIACLAGTGSAAQGTDESREADAKKIRRYIVRNLSNPMLDIDAICQEFGASRSAIYRIMGENSHIAAIIRILRLHAVARDLLSGLHDRESLATIATRWGLVDERSFRRAFRREFGFAPSMVRSKSGTTLVPGPISTMLTRWFLDYDLA